MLGSLLFLGLALVSGDAPPARVSAPPQAAATQSYDELSNKLGTALREERAEEALSVAKTMMAHPEFSRRPAGEQRRLHYVIGFLNAALERFDVAMPDLIIATEGPEAGWDEWLFRLDVQTRARDLDGATRTLAIMARRFPETLEQLSPTFVNQQAIHPAIDPELAFDLRLALFEAGWSRPHASGIWIRLIDDLIAHDRPAEVAAVFERITAPYAKLRFFAMRRYDAVRPSGAEFDVDAAYAAELESLRAAAAAPDATIEVRSDYVSGLMERGRFDEAVTEAEAALARLPLAGDDDDASQRTWVMDTRARALFRLGRRDEAIEQMRIAAKRDEVGGGGNVSQSINLGWFLLRLDRDAEALAAVRAVPKDEVSDFGWMQATLVRACAARKTGDETVARPGFAWLAEHWRDAPTAAYEALACQGDEDAMAAFLIRLLDEPEHANAAVEMMHDYLDPADRTAFDRRMADLHARVVARPEVVAARDAVGRAYVVPTTAPQF